jgi:hypothetical protein
MIYHRSAKHQGEGRFLVELSSRQNGSVLNLVTNWFDELHRRAPAKK